MACVKLTLNKLTNKATGRRRGLFDMDLTKIRVHRGGAAYQQGAGMAARGRCGGRSRKPRVHLQTQALTLSKQEVGPGPSDFLYQDSVSKRSHNLPQTAPPSGDLVFKCLSL